MADKYSHYQGGLTTPCEHAAAVTPHDTTALTQTTRALWVGGAGDVAVKLTDDSTAVTLAGVAAGTLIPVRAALVMSTNTTASSIVALW
jgi:hypothetical protein